MYSIQIVRNKY